MAHIASEIHRKQVVESDFAKNLAEMRVAEATAEAAILGVRLSLAL